MLVLRRRVGERIYIGGSIQVELRSCANNAAYIGVLAPEGVPIHREEILERIERDGPKKILPSPDCTVCKKTVHRIHSDLWWCPNCGTLHHPTGAAWFQAGEISVPRLSVDHYEMLSQVNMGGER